jgi:hypothetical protein
VLGGESAGPGTLSVADIIVRSSLDALDLLLAPQRLLATWRT